jgi:hypothetical protein
MKTLVSVAQIFLAACATSAAQPVSSTAAQAATPSVPASSGQSFVCKAFDRPSVYDSVKPVGEIRVSSPDDRSITSALFRFRVLYWNDRYDGRSFLTYVYSKTSGKLIEESLFQLDRASGPLNQFSRGEHGFTGLRYVYTPSGAELQYWCRYG